MTTETDDAITLLSQHFLLDEGKPLADVTAALATIGGSKQFEVLGRGMFAAMVKAHMAQLEGTKVTLVAQEPRGSLH